MRHVECQHLVKHKWINVSPKYWHPSLQKETQSTKCFASNRTRSPHLRSPAPHKGHMNIHNHKLQAKFGICHKVTEKIINKSFATIHIHWSVTIHIQILVPKFIYMPLISNIVAAPSGFGRWNYIGDVSEQWCMFIEGRILTEGRETMVRGASSQRSVLGGGAWRWRRQAAQPMGKGIVIGQRRLGAIGSCEAARGCVVVVQCSTGWHEARGELLALDVIGLWIRMGKSARGSQN
jgi:hypothetical protein